jgi:16S rRNA C967 or C1407 C5-methylase (RsmB/RsmF family)
VFLFENIFMTSCVCRDLSEYYGYISELTSFMLELFSPAECVEYMDASDRPRPLVIRANTLKTTVCMLPCLCGV